MSSSIVWNPTPEMLTQSEMAKYMAWVCTKYSLKLSNYQELHQWSVDHIEDFWESMWRYMDVQYDSTYSQVLEARKMPGANWFPGARLNFAKNILKPWMLGDPERVAIVALDEERNRIELTAEALIDQVTIFQAFLRTQGVRAGDHVAGIVCNDEKTIIASLAASSLGATWSSCSPEFGAESLIDRLEQVQPKVLFSVTGYTYNSREYVMGEKVKKVISALSELESVVWIQKTSKPFKMKDAKHVLWNDIARKDPQMDLTFVPMPFDHALYVLFSSGTTGKPKSIVHGAGGVLLQHYKEHALHCNLTEKSVLSYYTTCGWMMWNWMVSGLVTGAQLVLYDGAPHYPSIERLWRLIENEGITHLGTSAKFLSVCRKQEFSPKRMVETSSLENILSTGSPLVDKDYDWVYGHVKKDLQLTSICGGTDIVSCFVLGNPISPIYRGEIQCKGLGMDVAAFDESGKEVLNQKGELVCKSVAPSMPIYFLHDPEGARYQAAYFEKFNKVWNHGDFVAFNERGGSIIFGRSDTTLNPGGVRMGTSEMYQRLNSLPEIEDALVTSVPTESDEDIVLLVMLKTGSGINRHLKAKICDHIKSGLSPRHVPKHIFQVSQIPYTMSGKKVELAVRRIFQGQDVLNHGAIKNPNSLDEIRELVPSLLG